MGVSWTQSFGYIVVDNEDVKIICLRGEMVFMMTVMMMVVLMVMMREMVMMVVMMTVMMVTMIAMMMMMTQPFAGTALMISMRASHPPVPGHTLPLGPTGQ